MTESDAPPPPELAPWWVSASLAWGVLGIFLVVIVLSYLLKNDTLTIALFTAAAMNAKDIASYYFGSSAGSTTKDAALAATSIKQNETIAEQGKALAISAPAAPVTVTETTGPDSTTKTTTAPSDPPGKV